jgi:hypothetical protein
MAEMQIDEQGIVKEGRYSGYHINDVLRYAETLDTEVRKQLKDEPKPAAEPNKPEITLEQHAAQRVDQATLLTWQRLEQDDEAQFKAQAPDYEKYLERINKLKATLQPMQRIQRGLHKWLYEQLKAQEPDVQKAIYAKPPDEPEPKAEAKPPKPVPVTAPPTPAARAAAEPAGDEKKPTLKPTIKIQRAAQAWGIPIDEYLLRLEAQGMTQEQLDAQAAPPARGRRGAYERA